MNSKIRIISDLQLVLLDSIAVVVIGGGAVCGIWLVSNVSDANDRILMQGMFAFLLLVFLLAVIISVPKSICVLTLSNDTVFLKIPYQKKQPISYKRFAFIYHGGYFHGNIFGQGLWVHYIVFSQKRLSKDTLTHINMLKNSPETFKIRYSKRNYEKLCSILPHEIRCKMDSALAHSGNK